MLVDGIPTQVSISPMVPPSISGLSLGISKDEVVKGRLGPYSMAAGGVINIITKKPEVGRNVASGSPNGWRSIMFQVMRLGMT